MVAAAIPLKTAVFLWAVGRERGQDAALRRRITRLAKLSASIGEGNKDAPTISMILTE